MNESVPETPAMSAYEQQRWDDLQSHWDKETRGRRTVLPGNARSAIRTTADATKSAAARTGTVVAERTPARVRQVAERAVDAALVPTVKGVIELLEFMDMWVTELTDPEVVLRHHRQKGRSVESLDDLRQLDLEQLEELTNHLPLKWGTLGAGQGASFGALAMIPIPVLGSAAAIGLDLIAIKVLTRAIATRMCYAYGLDAARPEVQAIIDRMVSRSYAQQAAKAGSVKQASAAFSASKGRVNWSQKLRGDHRLMAAVEKLLKRVGDGGRVPVENARMGMPIISVLIGAGANARVLGDTARQARHYGATLLISQKYGLPLPSNLDDDIEGSDGATVDG